MLMLHVEENNFKEIQSLFNRNAVLNIDMQNKTGQNALILATRNGNFEIAQYLVSKNADINSQNKVLSSLKRNWLIHILGWTISFIYRLLVWIL